MARGFCAVFPPWRAFCALRVGCQPPRNARSQIRTQALQRLIVPLSGRHVQSRAQEADLCGCKPPAASARSGPLTLESCDPGRPRQARPRRPGPLLAPLRSRAWATALRAFVGEQHSRICEQLSSRFIVSTSSAGAPPGPRSSALAPPSVTSARGSMQARQRHIATGVLERRPPACRRLRRQPAQGFAGSSCSTRAARRALP